VRSSGITRPRNEEELTQSRKAAKKKRRKQRTALA
jgi:hypothetical protein